MTSQLMGHEFRMMGMGERHAVFFGSLMVLLMLNGCVQVSHVPRQEAGSQIAIANSERQAATGLNREAEGRGTRELSPQLETIPNRVTTGHTKASVAPSGQTSIKKTPSKKASGKMGAVNSPEDSSQLVAEPVSPAQHRDWSEVKYPWEEANAESLPTESSEMGGRSEGEATTDRAEGGAGLLAEPSLSTVKRDWSEVKYPWEETSVEPSPTESTKKGGLSTDETKGDRAEGESRLVVDTLSPPTHSDWSQLKYPWEEREAPRPMPAITKGKKLTEMKVCADKSPQPKNKRNPVSVDVNRVAIGDTQLELVKLPGGRFMMGSSNGDVDERPPHEVLLRPFQISRYEVTQRQWLSVMGENPSYFSECGDCPVDNVSWDDAQRFLDKLNQQTGKKFRLPSEAEWEYACQAQGDERYCGSSCEMQVAWHAQNSEGRSQPVGMLEANAFGLYDMSGNVYEWVADCWHGGYEDAPMDGRAWDSGDCQRRVLRGGAWYYTPAYATASYRNANTPVTRFIIYGFRLAHDD